MQHYKVRRLGLLAHAPSHLWKAETPCRSSAPASKTGKPHARSASHIVLYRFVCLTQISAEPRQHSPDLSFLTYFIRPRSIRVTSDDFPPFHSA